MAIRPEQSRLNSEKIGVRNASSDNPAIRRRVSQSTVSACRRRRAGPRLRGRVRRAFHFL